MSRVRPRRQHQDMDDPLSATSVMQRCPAGCDGGAQPRLDRTRPGRPLLTLGACVTCAGWGWITREPDDVADVMGRWGIHTSHDTDTQAMRYMGRARRWRGRT